MAKSKASFAKKELERKRQKQKQEKKEKMEERKNAPKKSLDDMMAYLDEDGNLTSAPPDPTKKKREFTLEDVPDTVARRIDEAQDQGPRTGVVTFFNRAKGFGFIIDDRTGDRIFVHMEQCQEPIGETDKVVFEVASGDRGPVATQVKKA